MPVQTPDVNVISSINTAGEIAISINSIIETLSASVVLLNNIETEVGDPTQLNTSSKVIVGAINELLNKFESGELLSSYVGLLSDLSTTDKQNIVGAVNEINLKLGDINSLPVSGNPDVASVLTSVLEQLEAINEAVGDGSISDAINAKFDKSGGTITGSTVIKIGAEGSAIEPLAFGYADQNPSWKVLIGDDGTFTIASYSAVTNLPTGNSLRVKRNGEILSTGSFSVGSAKIDSDGKLSGTAWNARGGSPDAITAIQSKVDGFISSSGGTIQGKINHKFGADNTATSIRDIGYDTTEKLWSEVLGADGAYLLQAFNKSNGNLLRTALTITQGGALTVTSTVTASQFISGTATFSNDGKIAGSAWNTWGGSPDAITAIQSKINANVPDLSNYYTKDQAYSKTQTYSKTETDSIISSFSTSIAAKASLSGANFTGNIGITGKQYPLFEWIYGGNKWWTYFDTGDQMFKFSYNEDPKFQISNSGAIWSKQFGDLNSRIETRASDFANDRVANLHTRLTARGTLTAYLGNTWWETPSGAVLTGGYTGGQFQIQYFYYRYLQLYDPVRGWISAFSD